MVTAETTTKQSSCIAIVRFFFFLVGVADTGAKDYCIKGQKNTKSIRMRMNNRKVEFGRKKKEMENVKRKQKKAEKLWREEKKTKL